VGVATIWSNERKRASGIDASARRLNHATSFDDTHGVHDAANARSMFVGQRYAWSAEIGCLHINRGSRSVSTAHLGGRHEKNCTHLR
jgi:hypothetical protein